MMMAKKKTTDPTVIFEEVNDKNSGIVRRADYILIIFGKEEDLGKEMKIEKEIVVGRSIKSDFTTDDPLISRKHFVVYPKDRKIYLKDLDSLNGTFLNQVEISNEKELRSGDIITAGRTVFKFEKRTELESMFHQYLYAAATTDRMTQLFNRYYFIEQFKKQIAYSKRYKKIFSILMIDIDDFKKVNDKYGHPVGDETLKFIAFKIMTSVRENDLACRYGGEEFAIILPETDSNGAHFVANRMRKAIESDTLAMDEYTINVTISIGISSFPKDSKDWKKLIKIADERLYIAKKRGKNRVVAEDED